MHIFWVLIYSKYNRQYDSSKGKKKPTVHVELRTLVQRDIWVGTLAHHPSDAFCVRAAVHSSRTRGVRLWGSCSCSPAFVWDVTFGFTKAWFGLRQWPDSKQPMVLWRDRWEEGRGRWGWRDVECALGSWPWASLHLSHLNQHQACGVGN